MKRRIAFFIIIILILIGVFILVKNVIKTTSFFPSFSSGKKESTLAIDGHKFTIESASTLKDKELGLSVKISIPQNYGMLFVFDSPSYYPFWMKSMHFPIDIIFIRNNHIVTIFNNVPNPKNPTDSLPIYKPDEPADTALEINAGLAKEYNFQKGDRVKLSL